MLLYIKGGGVLKLRSEKNTRLTDIFSYLNKFTEKLKTSFYDGITRILKDRDLSAAQKRYRTAKTISNKYQLRFKRTHLDRQIAKQFASRYSSQKKVTIWSLKYWQQAAMNYYDRESVMYENENTLNDYYNDLVSKPYKQNNIKNVKDVQVELLETFTLDTDKIGIEKRKKQMLEVTEFLLFNKRWRTGLNIDSHEYMNRIGLKSLTNESRIQSERNGTNEQNDFFLLLKELGLNVSKKNLAKIRVVLKNVNFNDMVNHIRRLDNVTKQLVDGKTIEEKFAVCSTILEAQMIILSSYAANTQDMEKLMILKPFVSKLYTDIRNTYHNMRKMHDIHTNMSRQQTLFDYKDKQTLFDYKDIQAGELLYNTTIMFEDYKNRLSHLERGKNAVDKLFGRMSDRERNLTVDILKRDKKDLLTAKQAGKISAGVDRMYKISQNVNLQNDVTEVMLKNFKSHRKAYFFSHEYFTKLDKHHFEVLSMNEDVGSILVDSYTCCLDLMNEMNNSIQKSRFYILVL